MLGVQTRRKLAVHIIGIKAGSGGTEVATADGAANGAAATNDSDSPGAASTQPEQGGEIVNGTTVHREAADPSTTASAASGTTPDVEGLSTAKSAASDSNAGEVEDDSTVASIKAEASALDTATAAADVLRVQDIWDFKRRQATWHSLP